MKDLIIGFILKIEMTRPGVTKFGPGGPVSLQSLAPTLIKHTWSS